MSSSSELHRVDEWWRAANYLSVGQIYLLDNPLLERPLEISDIKPRLLGHWGTCPGLNLVWAHLNRVIVRDQRKVVCVCGPGHGGPAAVANPWLELTYSELFPDITADRDGMRRLFRQFSFPGGVPSHAAPETPGSMHEGGELGYSLAHAHGAAFDAPDRIVACVVGDGEAETGALAASWNSIRFVNPATDGVVLPILHLNGWKIANPTILSRLPETQLRALFSGLGYEPWFVSGHDPADVHEQLASALDDVLVRIDQMRADTAASAATTRTMSGAWPIVILRTPKGWTGPTDIDGEPIEGNHRSHQVPLGHELGPRRLVTELDRWLRSYRPDELFDRSGAPAATLADLRPRGTLRMSADPTVNALGPASKLELPQLDLFEVPVLDSEGERTRSSAMSVAGDYLRDVIAANPDTFRLVGPDEVASNRLSSVFDVTDRAWREDGADPVTQQTVRRSSDRDDGSSADAPRVPGRVMEVLSEHLCQGWLEGYTLTGRHGVFTSYEAFIHIVDSMFNQHAKWLESANRVPWRQRVPSFNYLLSSHVWRQDHNGFSHQDPGFLDLVVNKRAEIARVYLPPDANSLIATIDRCLRSRQMINVVVAGKQTEPQYLTADEAAAHLDRGASTWHWAGNEGRTSADHPDVVLGCAGDVPTMEALAAARLLADDTDLVVRVVNVIDLMALQPEQVHPHGLSDPEYDSMFPPDRPTVFAFHGYPSLIHRLTYRRHHHADLHVHGFVEEGTTTTPFDMAVRNGIDRFHLAIAAVEHQSDGPRRRLAPAVAHWRHRLDDHGHHIRRHGEDPPWVQGAS